MASEARRVIGELEEAVEKAIASLGTNITAELIERTPVDTGWARANWVPNIGNPASGNEGAIGEAARRAGVPAQSARQESATAALLGYRIERGSVFINNNVPYIMFLNEGSSDQAPSGFVQDAILAGVRSLENRTLG